MGIIRKAAFSFPCDLSLDVCNVELLQPSHHLEGNTYLRMKPLEKASLSDGQKLGYSSIFEMRTYQSQESSHLFSSTPSFSLPPSSSSPPSLILD